MEAMVAAQRMTAEEYLLLPEQPMTNLVEGEVVVAQPLALHQAVARDLFLALHQWVSAGAQRGEVTFPLEVNLDDHNVYAPDVLWYREGRGPGRSEVRPQPLPDLAVEVRSPSTWRYDIGLKKAAYERHGLPELWLVDTAADEVISFRSASSPAAGFDAGVELARADTLSSPLLPGFALALEALFPR